MLKVADFLTTNDAIFSVGKTVTGIADATGTDVLTVTVPNVTTDFTLTVLAKASIGANGAVGAGEATRTVRYDFAVNRFAGAATVIGASSVYGSATAASAGATTIATTLAASAVSGANSATQTFTIQITITKGGGSSANHYCKVVGTVLILDGVGVTLT